MSKRRGDPLLHRLVSVIDETPGAAVPVAVSVRGAVLRGELISQETYFAQLAVGNPFLGALGTQDGSVHEGTGPDKKSSGDFVHLRSIGGEHGANQERGAHEKHGPSPDVWRIALGAVDGWMLLTSHGETDRDEHGEGGAIGSLFGRAAEH